MSSQPDTNPLEDGEIKDLLKNVDNIKSAHDFGTWQKSFLARFMTFLDAEGSKVAQVKYDKFSNSSNSLIKVVRQLQEYIDQGNLSKEKTTVKARNGMSELKVSLTKLVGEIQGLMPTTGAQIKKFGFSKYHMGAVLVQDGFREYAVLEFCSSLLKLLRAAALEDVADKSILGEIDYFNKQFGVFCGVMASLNLMNVCKLAAELLHSDLNEEAKKHAQAASNMSEMKGSGNASATDMKALMPSEDIVALVSKTPSSKDGKVDKVPDEESSYETIEQVEEVSSYEEVTKDDGSAYETVEEEVEVSDLETESEGSDADGEDKKKSTALTKRNGTGGTARGGRAGRQSNGSSATADRAGRRNAAAGDGDDDADGSGGEGDGAGDDDDDGVSDENPDPDHDPYKPVERMKWTSKDYYHGSRDCFLFMGKNKKNRERRKKPDPPPPPKEKQYRRVVRTETRKVQKKVEKPPTTVRVRHTREVVHKTRVKKDKAKSTAVTTTET